MTSSWTRTIAAVLACVAGGWLGVSRATPRPASDPGVSFTDDERRKILELSPLPSTPVDPSNAVADDDAAARLGQTLFFEPRLSRGDVSCATCHVPHHGFSDAKTVSEGVGHGRRRTLTLWNVAYNRWFFWDGRADSLWSQALVPIESETEMAGDRLRIAHLLAAEPALERGYERVFGPMPDLSDGGRFPAEGHPIPDRPDDPRHMAWSGMRDDDRTAVDRVFANVGKAIAAYERRLVSRHSEFDRFVEALRARKDTPGLSLRARRGLKLFVGRAGCRTCHNGPNFTDAEFHDTGITALDAAGAPDSGRRAGVPILLASPFNRSGPFSDDRSKTNGELLKMLRRTPESWGQFKTPSLRNVARCAPYMHRGQLATLNDVLEFYSTQAGTIDPGANGERILKPLHLTSEELGDLAAFLDSLTDESIDPALMRPPAAME